MSTQSALTFSSFNNNCIAFTLSMPPEDNFSNNDNDVKGNPLRRSEYACLEVYLFIKENLKTSGE